MKKQNKIQITNLHKSFGANHVLKDFDLEVKVGESVVIIGPSGIGKSVLLKCILGLLEVDSGTIKIDGKRIDNLSENKRSVVNKKIGMLFQNAALFDSLSIWENVSFRDIMDKNADEETAKKSALEYLSAVNLSEKVADMYPVDLSGGMKKRAGLARAVAGYPEILFFDEPTTGLDPITSDVINELIVKLTKKLGATTITITHDIKSALKIADTIAFLYDGKIQWKGTVKDFERTKDAFIVQMKRGSSRGPIKSII
ncbi:MAG: ATP-binding cassette domain-containing protein [Rickettsiales bacterium]|nr:ATP-binding cassette domain-containing protein [Rickettsiales bacterium]